MQKTQEMQVQSLHWEDPLKEEMAIRSCILAWRIPWTEEPDGLQSIGLQSQTRLKQVSVWWFSRVTIQHCPDFSGGPAVKSLPMPGMQAWYLVGELGSHMPRGNQALGIAATEPGCAATSTCHSQMNKNIFNPILSTKPFSQIELQLHVQPVYFSRACKMLETQDKRQWLQYTKRNLQNQK